MVNKLFPFFLLVALSLATIQPIHGDDQEELHVLFLMPFTNDYPVSTMITEGVKDELSQYSSQVEFSYEFMDLGKHPKDQAYLESLAIFLESRYDGHKPDIIYSMNAALPFMTQYLENLFPDVPTFVTADAGTGNLENLPDQIVIVSEKDQLRLRENIDLMLRLRPEVQNIYFIVGCSKNGQIVNEQLRKLEADYQGLEFIYVDTLTYLEMLELVGAAAPEDFIYYIQFFYDVTGKAYIPVQVLEAVKTEARAPILVAGSQFVAEATIGGYVYDFELMGHSVGATSLEAIESGEKPISPVYTYSNHYVFQWPELVRYDISEDRLPPHSTILNKEEKLLERYKSQVVIIMVVFVVQILLILLLIVNVRRRRTAELKLKKYNHTLLYQNDHMKKLATTDTLTQINNRLQIMKDLRFHILSYQQIEKNFSIIMIDIDYFKRFNDDYGHLAGDEVLVGLARFLSDHIRKSDIIGRWGGEEFLIICPDTELEGAKSLAEILRRRTEEKVFAGDYKLTISLGVAEVNKDDNEDTLFQKADYALYQAKKQGRNKVEVHQSIST